MSITVTSDRDGRDRHEREPDPDPELTPRDRAREIVAELSDRPRPRRVSARELENAFALAIADAEDRAVHFAATLIAGRAAHWEGRSMAWQHPSARHEARILHDEVTRILRDVSALANDE